jgi:hypothetical protein
VGGLSDEDVEDEDHRYQTWPGGTRPGRASVYKEEISYVEDFLRELKPHDVDSKMGHLIAGPQRHARQEGNRYRLHAVPPTRWTTSETRSVYSMDLVSLLLLRTWCRGVGRRSMEKGIQRGYQAGLQGPEGSDTAGTDALSEA